MREFPLPGTLIMCLFGCHPGTQLHIALLLSVPILSISFLALVSQRTLHKIRKAFIVTQNSQRYLSQQVVTERQNSQHDLSHIEEIGKARQNSVLCASCLFGPINDIYFSEDDFRQKHLKNVFIVRSDLCAVMAKPVNREDLKDGSQ